MEIALSIIIALMILGAIFALHARDLLSAVIASGIVGYGLVICFLLLKAPDLAIVQIVVETITLIIMVAVVLDSSRQELYVKPDPQGYIAIISSIVLVILLFYSVGHWNSWFSALIFLRSREKFQLQLIVREILISMTLSV